MQYTSLSSLQTGINDVYAELKPKKESNTLKVVLISTQVFPDMQTTQVTGGGAYRACDNNKMGFMYYRDTRSASSRPKMTVLNMQAIRDALTKHYAQINVENGIINSVTLSPSDAESIKKYDSIQVYYKDKNPLSKKTCIEKVELYSFAPEEFMKRYVEAAYRVQKILYLSIFAQQKPSILARFFNTMREEEKAYESGKPYIIEAQLPRHEIKYQRKFIGYSINSPKDSSDKTSSDPVFYSASSDSSSDEEFNSPTSGSPTSGSPDSSSSLDSLPPFLRSLAESSPNERKSITKFNELMDEISRLLEEKGLNITSNLSEKKRKFTLSMHFKRDYRDPNSILLTTQSLPYGGLYYTVPMEIEINFADGSTKKFDYVFVAGARISFKDPVWEKSQLKWGGPKTMQEHRKIAVYSAFLRAYVYREAIKRAVHDDAEGLALRKLISIYGDGSKPRVDFSPHISGDLSNFDKKKTVDFAALKKREVDKIALGFDDNDLMPFIVYLKDKKFIKINGKFMRIKNDQDLVKEKVFTAVDKIKSLNFVLDNPKYAPEYSAQ